MLGDGERDGGVEGKDRLKSGRVEEGEGEERRDTEL